MLVFASEKLEEHREHNSRADDILASHDLEACDQCHPQNRVHNTIILLQQVDELIAKIVSKFFLIYSTDMCKELEVLIKLVVFLGW